MIALPSTLIDSVAYSPDRACYGTLARGTSARKASNWNSKKANWGALTQSNHGCVSADRLIRVDQKVVPSVEGESSPIPSANTLPHSYVPQNQSSEGKGVRGGVIQTKVLLDAKKVTRNVFFQCIYRWSSLIVEYGSTG